MQGFKIRAWRDYYQITQEELALRSGLNTLTISRLENGYTSPRKTTARAIARALRVSIQNLRSEPPQS